MSPFVQTPTGRISQNDNKMNTRHDEHYVRSVTRMGDTRKVFTNQTIFTSNRIKLVEKGIKVDSALFERLVGHKLVPKLDDCLDVENGITADELRRNAADLLDNDPALAVLRGTPRLRSRILRAVEGIPLVPPIAFKLTVAASERPDVYDHSLRVALVALHLAVKSFFLTEKQLSELAAAAVLHDIGILHVQPELLRPGRRLDKSERHHLYAHPITAYLILREYPEYHPDISRAVFEHHERLDGSGYPRGIKENDICLGAQILMLAEVANTVFESSSASRNLARLSVLLRLNHRKFNRELGNRLLGLLTLMQAGQQGKSEQAPASASSASMTPRLLQLSQIFNDWSGSSTACPDDAPAPPIASIVDERLAELRRTLLGAGFDMDRPGLLADVVKEDPDALIELTILLDETRWQLTEIIHEAHRRMKDATREAPPVLAWIADTEAALAMDRQAAAAPAAAS